MAYSKELLDFIQHHPSVYHVIEGQKQLLLEAGYEQLLESRPWAVREGGKYFVTRNGSALIAFRVPKGRFHGFMMMASHSDSPALKIKENPEITVDGTYRKLNVELYGGALLAPWFDRPLSVAGRVFEKTAEGVRMRLVHVDRDLLLIPSLAIHMNREVNSGYEYKVQRDMLPLYGSASAKSLLEVVAQEANLPAEAILGHDLFVYNRQAPAIWGAEQEFMSSPRLDDLQCAFSSLCGFLEASPAESMPVHVVFDNEEIGSSTKQGAASGFLEDTLRRAVESLGLTENEYLEKLSQSFMLSADNAHGMHPNYMDKCDPVNHPVLGGGVVVKYSGNQKYTTDAASAAIVNILAERSGVKLQTFTNHSDIPGGTTLGNISIQHLAVKTADVGIAQLAMHSPYETCGSRDTEELVGLARALFSSSIVEHGEEEYLIQ
ncbi:M18 family aminopeptidase [Oscillibacter sp. MSJ-2]|uniref:M18 family aminopeptidase n=1 Tax=Dysosmobacter acutus TaxID=2841504 RepID=A0ABS6FA44_9FIRM|nr:M18 family aminopeptidase [Dysosmobacter acutus]MBU5627169.1 M18 family aminopeptidase [Dysosmobacter acutus]